MTIEDRCKKLNYLITCMKCEVSGKECNDNCPTQYLAGNMGEIIQNLEAISKELSKEHMAKEKLNEITCWIKDNIMRNGCIMFSSTIRGDEDYQNIDLIEVIASLHNMLYKEVTGNYYNYMFHWANKVGSWVYDDMFKPEEEKRERI